MIRGSLLICLSMVVQWTSAQELKIVINQIKDSQGVMMIGLYNTENSFIRKDKPWKGEIHTANSGTMSLVFKDIPHGEYAISVIHDANSNGKLDKSFLGIPKEGFGFSNDAMGSFGPPEFEEAKINWTGKEIFTLNLRYMH